MDRRGFALGLAVALLGVAVFAALAANGSIRQPAAAIEKARPIELASIGVGFLLSTAGLVTMFAAYAATAIDD